MNSRREEIKIWYRERKREREGGGGMKKYDGIWKIQTKTFDILVSEGGMIQIIIVCMAEASKEKGLFYGQWCIHKSNSTKKY